MYKVYKINETDIPAATWRIMKKAIKWLLIIYVGFNAYLIWQGALSIHGLGVAALVVIPAYAIALLMGAYLVKKGYRTLRIVLDDEGIAAEFYVRGGDKKIKWNNLKMVTRPDGTVELQDKQLSATYRKMTGEGRIQLIPEIEQFDDLITQINTLVPVVR